MEQRNLTELKRRFTKENCTFTRIAGCFINQGEEGPKIVGSFSENFLVKEEEEQYKFLELYKKSFSGKIGKNINLLEFSIASEEQGKMNDFLMKLRDSKLKNDALLQVFYEKIMEKFTNLPSYMVVLVHDAYDVIGRGGDGFKNIDSEEVFEYLSVCICPMELETPGLIFDKAKDNIVNKPRRNTVEMPTYGFTFPAFEDRSTNIHKIMIYTKKADDSYDDFTSSFFEIEATVSAEVQKEAFQSLIQNLSDHGISSISTVVDIHEAIAEKIKQEGDLTTIDTSELKRIVIDNGISEESAETFFEEFESSMKNSTVYASNIVPVKTMEIKTPDVVLKISSEKASKVETKLINNEKYLLIPIGDGSDVEINGISVKTNSGE